MTRTLWWGLLNRFRPEPVDHTKEALERLVQLQQRKIARLERERDQWKRDHDTLMALL